MGLQVPSNSGVIVADIDPRLVHQRRGQYQTLRNCLAALTLGFRRRTLGLRRRTLGLHRRTLGLRRRTLELCNVTHFVDHFQCARWLPPRTSHSAQHTWLGPHMRAVRRRLCNGCARQPCGRCTGPRVLRQNTECWHIRERAIECWHIRERAIEC